MSISVMMVMCLAMKDGSTECNVSARYSQSTTNNVEMCSNVADEAINNVLLYSNKQGWSKGICFEQSKYSAVTTGAVSYLESKGYKVNFKADKGN